MRYDTLNARLQIKIHSLFRLSRNCLPNISKRIYRIKLSCTASRSTGLIFIGWSLLSARLATFLDGVSIHIWVRINALNITLTRLYLLPPTIFRLRQIESVTRISNLSSTQSMPLNGSLIPDNLTFIFFIRILFLCYIPRSKTSIIYVVR